VNELDGLPLDAFEPGHDYEMGNQLAAVFLAEGWGVRPQPHGTLRMIRDGVGGVAEKPIDRVTDLQRGRTLRAAEAASNHLLVTAAALVE
jgi:hypothetical protein